MGEANIKQRRRRAFLKQHPYCCFCGGTAVASTIDHVPSRQMFMLRKRPKGLEVPACEHCNRATRQHEQVAAMLGRIFPNGRIPAEQDELVAIIKAVDNNNLGLLREMMPSREQTMRGAAAVSQLPGAAGVLNCSGPLVNNCIQKFGAKLGFALHYATTTRIVPKTGGVAIRWYSNYDAVTEGLPPELFRFLGPEQTLRQGSWSAGDQFNYAYAVDGTGAVAAYLATFRLSFAVLCWVNEDASGFGEVNDIHRPGEL